MIGTYMSIICVLEINSIGSMLLSIDDTDIIPMIFKALVQVMVQRLILSRIIATFKQSLRISLHFWRVLMIVQINQTSFLLLFLGMS